MRTTGIIARLAQTHKRMNLAEGKLGLLGFAALVIAIIGLWKFAVSTWASSHPDQPIAQAAIHFW